jgi:hypothetical protein
MAAYQTVRDDFLTEEAEIIERADKQHRQVQLGQLDGIYGDYPVPDSVRGMGIWLTDK